MAVSAEARGAPLVLASSSPRRLALLRQAMIEPDRVIAPEIDEAVRSGELPRPYAERMAVEKAMAVAALPAAAGAYVLAADTVVACGRRILPKAGSLGEARRCLDLLAGRRHRVHGGLAVVGPEGRRAVRTVVTVVEIKRLSRAEQALLLRSGEWLGKAGGYAIQGLSAASIRSINGSYTNVVGMALLEALQMLEGLGWVRPMPDLAPLDGDTAPRAPVVALS